MPAGARDFPDRLWGPPGLVLTGYRGCLPGLKRPGRDVDLSLPYSAEALLVCLHGVDRDSFTFYYCYCCCYFEICALLGYYAASNGNPLPTFWDRVKKSKTLEDGTDTLSRNVGKGLTIRRCIISQKSADLIFCRNLYGTLPQKGCLEVFGFSVLWIRNVRLIYLRP